MRLTKKHLILGCFISLLLFSFTGCKKGPEETVSPKKTVDAYCKSVLKQNHSDLISVLGYSKEHAAKVDASFNTALSSKLEQGAASLNTSIDKKIITQTCEFMTNQTKRIKYSSKQVSKTKDTVTYELTSQILDYSPLTESISAKVKEQIKNNKIQTKEQIKDALINETTTYFKEIKPSKEKKSLKLTLKEKTVTIDDTKVKRYVPEDESAFIQEIQNLVIKY
ncbi:MAG: hypothetical protein PHD56_01260 [Anaerostipes sp.]|nr:hypothetical protein [Anaerostipes sp.]